MSWWADAAVPDDAGPEGLEEIRELRAENAKLIAGMRQIAFCRNRHPCATCTTIAREHVVAVPSNSKESGQ